MVETKYSIFINFLKNKKSTTINNIKINDYFVVCYNKEFYYIEQRIKRNNNILTNENILNVNKSEINQNTKISKIIYYDEHEKEEKNKGKKFIAYTKEEIKDCMFWKITEDEVNKLIFLLNI